MTGNHSKSGRIQMGLKRAACRVVKRSDFSSMKRLVTLWLLLALCLTAALALGETRSPATGSSPM